MAKAEKKEEAKKTKPAPPPIGIHFGKTDLERFGYFAELSYLHGRGYIPPITEPNIRDPKKRQMLPGFPKWKTTGLQDCYFDKVFKRIMQGEAYNAPPKPAAKGKKKEPQKKEQKKEIFKPASCTHLHATPGDFFGCFTKKPPKAFDPRIRPPVEKKKKKGKEKEKKEKKLVQFIPPNPGKKGGYGYVGITINPYPKYMASPFEQKIVKPDKKKDEKTKKPPWVPPPVPGFFHKAYSADRNPYLRKVDAIWSLFGTFRPPHPTKSLGGCMAGCFEKWPSHSANQYFDPWRIQKSGGPPPKPGKKPPEKKKEKEKASVWFPNGTGKTNPTPSVLERKVYIATNERTWRTMKPITYIREFI